MSQTALGRQLGVSHRTIRLWEMGKVRLTLVRVLELAGCRLDELVELEKPPTSA